MERPSDHSNTTRVDLLCGISESVRNCGKPKPNHSLIRRITDLATDQNSDETIMILAGHIDRRMMSHYSHIRRDARREAVKGLSKRNPRPTWDTVQSTVQTVENVDLRGKPSLQVLEKNGGDDETRTRDLCRDRAAF